MHMYKVLTESYTQRILRQFLCKFVWVESQDSEQTKRLYLVFLFQQELEFTIFSPPLDGT